MTSLFTLFLKRKNGNSRMMKEEYVKTLNVGGHEIKLGLDDYGQCYFIEWADPLTGELKETGLGTYNFNYMEDIYYLFDDRYKELVRRELFGELSDGETAEMENYRRIFDEEYDFYGVEK